MISMKLLIVGSMVTLALPVNAGTEDRLLQFKKMSLPQVMSVAYYCGALAERNIQLKHDSNAAAICEQVSIIATKYVMEKP